MKENINHRKLCRTRLAVAIACSLIAFAAAQGLSQSPVATPDVASAAPSEEEATPAAAAKQKGGIKVHGHWVIEVKRKDGTVAERREFENSYNGVNFMGYLLSGLAVSTDPVIQLSSSANGPTSLCNGLSQISGKAPTNYCLIFANTTDGHGWLDTTNGFCTVPGSCYTGLTSTLTPAVGGGFTSYVLNATITPITTGSFDTVSTSVTACYTGNASGPTGTSTENPSDCYTDHSDGANEYIANYNLTATVLPGGAVTVTAGESLVFTVTISFS